jgi:hypothetical protein
VTQHAADCDLLAGFFGSFKHERLPTALSGVNRSEQSGSAAPDCTSFFNLISFTPPPKS